MIIFGPKDNRFYSISLDSTGTVYDNIIILFYGAELNCLTYLNGLYGRYSKYKLYCVIYIRKFCK